MSHPKLYTLEEVSDLLGLASSTVRRKTYSGEIKAVKLGSSQNARLRYPQASIDEYLAAHVTTATR